MMGNFIKRVNQEFIEIRKVLISLSEYSITGRVIALVILVWLTITLYLTLKAKNTGFEQKNLWDWLELLVVPLVLIVLGFIFNRVERKRAEEVQKLAKLESEDRLIESEFQGFLTIITELMEKGLRESEAHSVLQDVARIRALTTLRRLDAVRKGLLIKFLYEADLIVKKEYTNWDNLILVNSMSATPVIFLHEADLSGALLDDTNLSYANLMEANLRNGKLRNCNLWKTIFWKSDLSNVDFTDSDLWQTFCIEADLSNSVFTNSRIEETVFKGSKFNGACFKNSSINRADFRQCDLRGADFTEAIISNINLTQSIIDSSTLIENKWFSIWKLINNQTENSDFSNLDLTNICMKLQWKNEELDRLFIHHISFMNTNFSESIIYKTTFVNCNFENAVINDVRFERVVFADCDLRKTIFSESILIEASFVRCKLNESVFDYCNLENAKFRECYLDDSRFVKAFLLGTKIDETTLFNCNFQGSFVNETTHIDQEIIQEWDIIEDGFGRSFLQQKRGV